MPNQHRPAIVRYLLTHPGRQETKDIADGVSMALTGKPAVQRREDDNSVVYDTITKELFNMTQPNNPSFCDTLARDGRGGWWLEGIPATPLLDLIPAAYQPGKPGPANRARPILRERKVTVRDRKNTDFMRRRFLARLLEAQCRTCAGCGKGEPRHDDHLWQVDHIVPFGKGGPTEFGNLQALCWPCNARKGGLEQKEFWAANQEAGAMWDMKQARIAHERAKALQA